MYIWCKIHSRKIRVWNVELTFILDLLISAIIWRYHKYQQLNSWITNSTLDINNLWTFWWFWQSANRVAILYRLQRAIEWTIMHFLVTSMRFCNTKNGYHWVGCWPGAWSEPRHHSKQHCLPSDINRWIYIYSTYARNSSHHCSTQVNGWNINCREIYVLQYNKGKIEVYRQVSNIRRTKPQHLKDSRTVLRLFLSNPWRPDVKSRMKM